MIRAAVLPVLVLVFLAAPVVAADRRPAYKPFRYDEDWRALCDDAPRDRQPLRCIFIANNATLSVGGDLRERAEIADNPGFGLRETRDRAFLTRAMVHADLRVGPALRAFVQVGFFEQAERKGGASATDVDRGDLMQGFVDLSGDAAGGRATLRAGRQEIGLGSSRIVSVRDGPNIRRAFDGVRGFWTRGAYRVDAIYLQPVTIGPGAFDDRTTGGEHLTGVYASGPVPGGGALKADVYFLDYARDDARFAVGRADERRRSLGVRLFGTARGVDWDVEGLYQWGRFGVRPISAWTVASNIGYTFDVAGAPRIGLKADIASGDRGGRSLGTFNALYPKLPYFSEANLVAPANVIDVHPEVSVALTPAVRPYVGWNTLWRETTRDAIYAPPLAPIADTAGRGGHNTGSQAIAGFDWQASRQITVAAQYVHFTPGAAIRSVGGRGSDFLTASIGYRF